MTKIYDEMCGWPYHTPYGMVTAPKVKKPRRKRKSRAMPLWLKEQRKKQRTHRRRLPQPLSPGKSEIILNPEE